MKDKSENKKEAPAKPNHQEPFELPGPRPEQEKEEKKNISPDSED